VFLRMRTSPAVTWSTPAPWLNAITLPAPASSPPIHTSPEAHVRPMPEAALPRAPWPSGVAPMVLPSMRTSSMSVQPSIRMP